MSYWTVFRLFILLFFSDFDWKEALDFGLVSHVFETRDDLLKGAFDLAALISSRSPVATLGTKHLLIHARDHTVQDGLDYTKLWNSGTNLCICSSYS